MLNCTTPVWHAVEWDNKGPHLCLEEGYYSTLVVQINCCTISPQGYGFFQTVLTFWTKASDTLVAAYLKREKHIM